MSIRKVFCDECRNDVEFTITTKQIEGSIKGENICSLAKKLVAWIVEKSSMLVK